MGPCRLLKTIFAQFLGKYRVVLALFGKIERLTFTGTFDAFQHLVKSHSFKQICFPHRSEMGVLKSFLWHLELHHSWFQARRRLKSYFLTIPYPIGSLRTGCLRASRRAADGLRRILPGKSVTNRPQGAEEPRVRGSNRVSCWVRLQSPASDHELSSGPRRLSTHHRHHRHRSRGRPFLHGQVLQHQGDAILLRHGPRALAKEKGGD